MPTLTIAVMTLNEAAQIEACLRSARFADQLLVLDSGSTDNTVPLARQCGAEVHTSTDWQGFAEQRNRMLALSRSDWVLFLDADEVIPPELAHDIQAAVARDDTCVYALKWLQIAFGQPLTRMRAGRGQPRLFPRRELIRYEGVVHEGPVLHHPDTPRHLLVHPLEHHSRRTVHQSLVKLAQYAQLGAVKRAGTDRKGGLLRGTASGLANFFRMYIVHGGILCGRAGFLHCLFVALESFFRYVALDVDREHLNQPVSR